jgi:hypothetical protein
MIKLSEQMDDCPECGYRGKIGYTQGAHVPNASQCLRIQLAAAQQSTAFARSNYEIMLTACQEAEMRAAIANRALGIVADEIQDIDSLCDQHYASDYCEAHCDDGMAACLKHWAEELLCAEAQTELSKTRSEK